MVRNGIPLKIQLNISQMFWETKTPPPPPLCLFAWLLQAQSEVLVPSTWLRCFFACRCSSHGELHATSWGDIVLLSFYFSTSWEFTYMSVIVRYAEQLQTHLHFPVPVEGETRRHQKRFQPCPSPEFFYLFPRICSDPLSHLCRDRTAELLRDRKLLRWCVKTFLILCFSITQINKQRKSMKMSKTFNYCNCLSVNYTGRW